jgi:glutathione S-transferase
MLKVLGRPSSINVRKVLWLAAELDLPIEHEARWGEPGTLAAPEYRALNPNGLVPVIVDNDFVLWESNAICRYLASREHRDDLYPTDLRARAIVEQWMDWQTTQLNIAWRYAFLALVRRTPPEPDPGAIADSTAAWHRHMAILDARLVRTGAWVAGERFTLADLVLGLSTHRWLSTPLDRRPELPAVLAFEQRLRDRPGYRLHGRNGTP